MPLGECKEQRKPRAVCDARPGWFNPEDERLTSKAVHFGPAIDTHRGWALTVHATAEHFKTTPAYVPQHEHRHWPTRESNRDRGRTLERSLRPLYPTLSDSDRLDCFRGVSLVCPAGLVGAVESFLSMHLSTRAVSSFSAIIVHGYDRLRWQWGITQCCRDRHTVNSSLSRTYQRCRHLHGIRADFNAIWHDCILCSLPSLIVIEGAPMRWHRSGFYSIYLYIHPQLIAVFCLLCSQALKSVIVIQIQDPCPASGCELDAQSKSIQSTVYSLLIHLKYMDFSITVVFISPNWF